MRLQMTAQINRSDSPDRIWFNEVSLGMVGAGLRALEEWETLPEHKRSQSNRVAMVYSAVEAERRRECAEK